ncbi:diguanylate cyclase (GGDEF)-like protein [Kineococcus xinjiangensis]|uniref:Diguanylate cyclase (GGDEF)-like protein n=1 Tax=Kineococcus xinjiangensis TaxID=512762 RepID=A0A2S6IEH2_9ACTN|nr:diguanylate cyclase [Kineococcus xinjiangensis]PPK92597.1 diguanylate cyclase (GGDEF)-like protein [Kineococcus xinjiangensis]
MSGGLRLALTFVRPRLEEPVRDCAERQATALRNLHELAVGISAHRDLGLALQAVSEAARELGFGVAVVNLVRDDGDLEVVAVAGDEEAREALWGKVSARASWDELLAAGDELHGTVFLDHATVTWPEEQAMAAWIPEAGSSDDDPDAFHPEDALFVPMLTADGELLGTLSVDLPTDGRRPGAQTRELLGMFGSHAALAIDHARLLRDLKAEQAEQQVLVRRLQALLELSRQLAATSERGQVIRVTAQALAEVVGCDQGAVLLWDDDRSSLRSTAVEPAAGPVLSAHLDAADCPEARRLAGRGDPIRLNATTASPPVRRLLGAWGATEALAIPLGGCDLPAGALIAGWREGGTLDRGSADTVARLRALADQASTALANAQLVDAVRHQSLHDTLTGLANRRLIAERLQELLDACSPQDGVAVVYCDLDGFKAVNDTFGHGAGDELLRAATSRLLTSVRTGDVVGRLGGDEFVVLLPDAHDEDEVAGTAQRIAARFERPFHVEGTAVHVPTSVGVAVHRGCGGDPDVLMRHADAAMYLAKRSGCAGRSRVVQAPTSHGPAVTGAPVALSAAALDD